MHQQPVTLASHHQPLFTVRCGHHHPRWPITCSELSSHLQVHSMWCNSKQPASHVPCRWSEPLCPC